MTTQMTHPGPAKRARLGLLGAALAAGVAGAALLLASGQAAQAQFAAPPVVPAFLPVVNQVPAGDPSPIDGIWMIREIGKRIAIEGGRGYAVDGWLHAMVLQIQPQMVILENVAESAPGVYSADDLPMMGRAILTVQGDGSIVAQIQSAIPSTFHFDPVQLSYPGPFRDDMTASQQSRRYPGNSNGGGIDMGAPIRVPVAGGPGYSHAGGGSGAGYGGGAPQDPNGSAGDQQGNPAGAPANPNVAGGAGAPAAAPRQAGNGGGGLTDTEKEVGVAATVGGGALVYKLTRGGADNAEAQDVFERGVMKKAGPEGMQQMLKSGDAARAARGMGPSNEGEMIRNINSPENIGRVNQAGRAAQDVRGLDSAARTAKAVKEAGKVAKLAKFAKGATVVGVGTAVAGEALKATIGAKIDDPIDVGARYGHAVFSAHPFKNVKKVMDARLEHHEENVHRLVETVTTKGKLGQNLHNYGAKAGCGIANVFRKKTDKKQC